MSFDLVLANLKRIIANVDLPVSIDLEGSYGESPTEVQKNITKVIEKRYRRQKNEPII